jgi:hypothetical protein
LSTATSQGTKAVSTKIPASRLADGSGSLLKSAPSGSVLSYSYASTQSKTNLPP